MEKYTKSNHILPNKKSVFIVLQINDYNHFNNVWVKNIVLEGSLRLKSSKDVKKCFGGHKFEL